MLGTKQVHRCVGRLCALLITLSILAVMMPSTAQAQMCVRYARQLTHFDIRGDAWAWWQNSAGRYQHGMRPVEGSVLVFQRTGRLHQGHVSTVSQVVDRRTILVDHSWLEGDTLHRGMKVIDTSPNNTWTSVKVWYEPADHLGLRAYPTYGFIYPRDNKGFSQPLAVAANDDDERDGPPEAIRPAGRRPAAQAPIAHVPATRVASATTPTPKGQTQGAQAGTLQMASLFLPHRKPASPGSAPAARGAANGASSGVESVVAAYVPRRKPGSQTVPVHVLTPAPIGVEFSAVPQVPRHKPSGHGGPQQLADARGGAELSD